jgi:hypothetical protein
MVAMRSLRALVTAAILLGGCSSETAILLRVTRDDSVPANVPRLHIALGVKASSDVLAPATGTTGTTPTYVDDASDRIDVGAIDLKTAPYELMLRPSQQLTLDTGLELAAVALDGDGPDAKPLAFGAIGYEVHFHQGETLVYEITLGAIGDPTADPARRECGVLVGSAGSIFACRQGCVSFDGVWIGAHDDIDCDGDPHGTDCDDFDWTVNHRATDVCNNGKNDDCTGGVDDGIDRDGDGLTPCQGDCVDNPTVAGSQDIHPGAIEIAHNGIDDNCSGMCDENDDTDLDTYTKDGFRTTDPSPIDRTCAAAAIDCNDLVAAIHPGAAEIDGNGFDDDCDGTCDVDADGDGFTAGGYVEPPQAGTAQCKLAIADCDDDPNDVRNGTPAAQIHPGAPELCDGVDDNCNAKCDEGLDPDGDHFTVCGTVNDGATICTYVGAPTCAGNGAACDCAENKTTVFPGGPGPEVCDGYDESCDGILYAMDTPCFALDANDVCRAGTRTCDDTTPPGALGACAIGTTQAPPEACNAFSACQGSADPIGCVASQLGNVARLGCSANLDKSQKPVDLCPAPPASYVAPLPAIAGTANCGGIDWTLVGGEQHGAWKVGISDATSSSGSPGPTVGGTCMVNLTVEKVAGVPNSTVPPPPTIFFVIAQSGATSSMLVIDLAGDTNLACPSGPALHCGG